MIKAQELRIGNWVTEKHIGSSQISGIPDDYEIVYVEGAGMCNIDDIEPIPLTPEILEKCGFHIESIIDTEYKKFNLTTKTVVYSDWDWIDESGGFEIKITTNSNDDKEAINTKFASNIKHLHQLQNLYFALTGEELELKKLAQ